LASALLPSAAPPSSAADVLSSLRRPILLDLGLNMGISPVIAVILSSSNCRYEAYQGGKQESVAGLIFFAY
jgi:hypothetical protein